jgi:hypothetical protein
MCLAAAAAATLKSATQHAVARSKSMQSHLGPQQLAMFITPILKLHTLK